MAKKSSKKPKDLEIHIDGNVTGSNILVGENISVVQQLEAAKAAALFTIPPPVTDFTGREKELEKLKASFQTGALITGLSGGGGVGKTELARKLANEIADAYPDARLNMDLLGTSARSARARRGHAAFARAVLPEPKTARRPAGIERLVPADLRKRKSPAPAG
ncbi:MAG: hypothetical protein HND47_14440 [Chloroflexi bacterium]|nr:hypothetical protein [Chloroflexota bacterium]